MNSLTKDELTTLLAKAGISPRLRRELRYVPSEITNWRDRDFLAVMNKAKNNGVFVVPYGDTLVLKAFELQKRKSNSSGRVEPITCDICYTWQRGTNSALLTLRKANASETFLVCGDLRCSLHVRDKTTEAVLSRVQLKESIDATERVARLLVKLKAILNIA